MEEERRNSKEFSRGPNSGPTTEVAQLLGAVRMFSMAVQETMEAAIQTELAGDRLSRAQWKLLEIFALAEVTNVTEVAAYQGVSTAAASKAVDRLVRIGLLTREEDHDDRRHIRLSLSEEGRALADAFLYRIGNRMGEAFRAWTGETLGTVRREIDALTVAAMRSSDSPPDRFCLQCRLHRRADCMIEEKLGKSCQFHAVHKPIVRYAEAHAGD